MFSPKLEISFLLTLAVMLATFTSCNGQTANSQQRDGIALQTGGSVSAITAMSAKRAAHTATLLNNGKVLMAGGFVAGGGSLPSAELFDPARNTFTPAGNMTVPRASHTATLLPDGKVLIAGGYNGTYLNTSEIYDPAANRFTPAARLVTARSEHAAVVLNDGQILIAGGVGMGWTFLKDSELYDPVKGSFALTGSMSVPRESHTATLLSDGKVLITGGHKDRRANITIYRSSEIYDPAKRRFTATGDLTIRRHKHGATRLADGRVLIIGGSDERDGDGAYRNAELYDPVKGAFTAVKNAMNAARYKLQGTAILLNDGKVLIAGGSDRAEVFDPKTNRFTVSNGEMGSLRLFSTATLLKSGNVLIAGGYHDGMNVSDSAWLYRV